MNKVLKFNPINAAAVLFFSGFLFLGFTASAHAATYYWVGGTTNSNTSNPANWNTAAGACADSANANVPTAADDIHFDSSCTNSVTVDSALSVNNFYLDAGYSGTVAQGENNISTSGFSIAGGGFITWTTVKFNGGVVSAYGTTLTFSSAATFNGSVSATYPSIFVISAIFNGTTSFTKTGALNDKVVGTAVTFNSTTSITNSGTGYMALDYGSSGVYTYNGNVTFTNNGSATLYAAINGTNNFSGNVTVVPTSGTVDFGINSGGHGLNFKAAGAQTFDSGGAAVYKIIHSGTGILQLTGHNLTVNTSLDNSAGTLDLNGFNLTTTGATFTNEAILKLTGDETVGTVAPTLNNGSTVIYSATSGSRILKSWTYTNATLEINGAGGTFTLPANITVKAINIVAGTLDASTNSYNIND